MRRFSDFAKEEIGLDGDKIQISDALNKEIYLIGFRIIESKIIKGKPCLQLQFKIDGMTHVTFTNSVVLIRQIEKYKEHLPFVTTIRKRNSYYTFS